MIAKLRGVLSLFYTFSSSVLILGTTVASPRLKIGKRREEKIERMGKLIKKMPDIAKD